MDAASFGRSLAARHVQADVDPAVSLLNYAESSRAGDWSLRSALMRMAQPEPERVARVLTSVRRLDAVLHHVSRTLFRDGVVCDRSLDVDADGATDLYADARVADLARMVALFDADGARALDAYQGDHELSEEALRSIPLVGVALEFDRLADVLAAWAADRRGPPPVAAVDECCVVVETRLDALGVPVEEGPPPGSGRRRA